jgi:lipopolysaccharide heptosyltransferase I
MLEINGNEPAILIIKPSSLGDIFHVFPAVEMLRRFWPGAKIDWMIRSELAPILQFYPHIRRTIEFPRKQLGFKTSFPGAFKRLVSDLRQEEYDLIIDFQGLFRSAFFACCAKARYRVGFAAPREKISRFFYNVRLPIPEHSIHAVEKNIQLVCGVTGQPFEVLKPKLVPPPEIKRQVDVLLNDFDGKPENTLGIIPGARWESKRWEPEFYAKTVERLHRNAPDMRFLVIGGPDDREAAEFICKHAPANRIKSLVGQTGIGELVETINRCRALLSGDSGPVHIAAAFDRKVFAVFGPTDPERTGPYGGGHDIFKLPLDCIACLKRECPINTLDCHNIEPANVADAICQTFNNGEAK